MSEGPGRSKDRTEEKNKGLREKVHIYLVGNVKPKQLIPDLCASLALISDQAEGRNKQDATFVSLPLTPHVDITLTRNAGTILTRVESHDRLSRTRPSFP